MEPVTLILKAAPIGLGVAGNLALRAKLSKIEQKLDELRDQGHQVITREFLGAFEAIEDASASNHVDTVSGRLKFAEESLLRNMNLNPNLTTAGYKNCTWMMLAHIGLAHIANLRGAEGLAASHLLRAFIADPRKARTELLVELYSQVLEPELEEIKDRYESEIEKINFGPGRLLYIQLLRQTRILGVVYTFRLLGGPSRWPAWGQGRPKTPLQDGSEW